MKARFCCCRNKELLGVKLIQRKKNVVARGSRILYQMLIPQVHGATKDTFDFITHILLRKKLIQ